MRVLLIRGRAELDVVEFQTLGVILLLLGLEGATTDSDEGTSVLLRDLAYVGVGAAFMLAAIASPIVERGRRAVPAPPSQQGVPQQQYGAPGAPPAWGRPARAPRKCRGTRIGSVGLRRSACEHPGRG